MLWILIAGTIIYVVLMIEAVTRKPDEKLGSQFGKEKKKQKEPEKEKEKSWPPKEEKD